MTTEIKSSRTEAAPLGFFGIKHKTRAKCYWTHTGWDDGECAGLHMLMFTPRDQARFALPEDGEWIEIALRDWTDAPPRFDKVVIK